MSRFLTKILNEKPGESKTKLEIVQKADQTQTIPIPEATQTDSQTSTIPNPTPDTTQTSTIKVGRHQAQTRRENPKSIAPERDFNKRANILEREALPNGLFPGASKAIYDALYLRTLGAVISKRTIQATRKELMKWSGIKNIKTINNHLKKLKDSNLIGVTNFAGEQTGSHYEVFLPNKARPDQTQTTQTKGNPEANQKMDLDQSQKTVWVGSGKTIENNDTYEFSKTSLKTNTRNDDDTRVNEAFSVLNNRLDAAVKKITGKGVSRNEAEKWGTLAELLILEMEQAASRTDSISSMPAFLTEVLRRKLLGGNYTTATVKNSKSKPDTVGKPNEAGDYEIKPLDEKGREAAVEQLREFAGDDFLPEFKKWYTAEDWEWIMKKLGIN